VKHRQCCPIPMSIGASSEVFKPKATEVIKKFEVDNPSRIFDVFFVLAIFLCITIIRRVTAASAAEADGCVDFSHRGRIVNTCPQPITVAFYGGGYSTWASTDVEKNQVSRR
jgi:hypothetical protein